uniref:Cytochrome b-c1 complex subunit 10 n=1 Tax=Sinocyclocheilus anshuiensis TaxID=1608454 RepID=A0A671LTZ3_9TELE
IVAKCFLHCSIRLKNIYLTIYIVLQVPTLAVWGGVGGVALVHFSDWRLILDYVPYINGKFKKED